MFTLLETLYHSFDQIAKRRRVFKVETVGDCYVGKNQDIALFIDTVVSQTQIFLSSLKLFVDFRFPVKTTPL